MYEVKKMEMLPSDETNKWILQELSKFIAYLVFVSGIENMTLISHINCLTTILFTRLPLDIALYQTLNSSICQTCEPDRSATFPTLYNKTFPNSTARKARVCFNAGKIHYLYSF